MTEPKKKVLIFWKYTNPIEGSHALHNNRIDLCEGREVLLIIKISKAQHGTARNIRRNSLRMVENVWVKKCLKTCFKFFCTKIRRVCVCLRARAGNHFWTILPIFIGQSIFSEDILKDIVYFSILSIFVCFITKKLLGIFRFFFIFLIGYSQYPNIINFY